MPLEVSGFGMVGARDVLRRPDGVEARFRMMRDGSLSVADWLQSMILEGYGYAAQAGSASTALTFLTYAANRPDAWLRVPSGITILPISAFVALEASAGTKTNVEFRMANNDIGNGTSTASTGPVNLRADLGAGQSLVVPRHLATADTTAETNPMSLHRVVFAVAEGTGTDARSLVWTPRPMPLLVGPATLEIFVSATTTQAAGYAGFSWIELPSTLLAA